MGDGQKKTSCKEEYGKVISWFLAGGSQAWALSLIARCNLIAYVQPLQRILLAQPPERFLNLSTAPHPGLGTAICHLNTCSSLLPGLLASILPHWQSVMHQEPEGVFKAVIRIILPSRLQNILGASCCHPSETHLPPQPPRSRLPTSVTSSVPTSPLSL